MIKKLIIMGILMIPFLLLTRVATAQEYSNMPKEIQAKMDQNKSEGKELLNGVYVHYELQFGGVEDYDASKKLQEILSANLGAVNYSFDINNKHVSFVCPAKYNLKSIKSYLKEDGMNINHMFKEKYSLSKD